MAASSFTDFHSAEDCEYTTSEELQAIKSYDFTIEIVGYIDGIEASRTVGVKSHTLLKFFVSNNTGDRVQCIVWNNDVKRIEPILRTNYVCTGLKIRMNSLLIIPDLIDLKDVSTSSGFIRVEGYVKSNFLIVTRQTVKSNDYGCGSITDGEYKLEVRITQMDNNNHDFEKGAHVEISGNLQKTANPIHLLVKSLEMVKLIDHEKMPLPKLLKGSKCIVLRKEDTNSNGAPAQKKAKQN